MPVAVGCAQDCMLETEGCEEEMEVRNHIGCVFKLQSFLPSGELIHHFSQGTNPWAQFLRKGLTLYCHHRLKSSGSCFCSLWQQPAPLQQSSAGPELLPCAPPGWHLEAAAQAAALQHRLRGQLQRLVLAPPTLQGFRISFPI